MNVAKTQPPFWCNKTDERDDHETIAKWTNPDETPRHSVLRITCKKVYSNCIL